MTRRHAHADEYHRPRKTTDEQVEGLGLIAEPFAQTLPAEPKKGSMPMAEPYAAGSKASQDAADRLMRSGQGEKLRELALLAYAEAYPRGMTPDECADAIGRHWIRVRPRCSQLVNLGWVERTGVQRLSAMENPADELVITDAGLRAARAIRNRRASA